MWWCKSTFSKVSNVTRIASRDNAIEISMQYLNIIDVRTTKDLKKKTKIQTSHLNSIHLKDISSNS